MTDIQTFKRLLSLARQNSVRAQKYTDEIIDVLKENGIDPSEITNDVLHYENANNLEEAIMCYVNYGESSPEIILKDIGDAIEGGC